MPKKKRRKLRLTARFYIIMLLLIVVVVLGVFVMMPEKDDDDSISHIGMGTPLPTIEPGNVDQTPNQGEENPPEATPTATPLPLPSPIALPNPRSGFAGTLPSDFGLQTAMQLDGKEVSSYQSPYDLTFPNPEEYTQLEGVITFRGNTYRDDPTYGNAGKVTQKKLTLEWTTSIPGSIAKSNPNDGSWFGCGWTGQPLIVRWPQATKNIMNLYDGKKNKNGLVEIVYATENSYIYFLDLDDGSATRDRINSRWTLKGAGSLDPRGYPLLYVGAGDAGPNGPAENMIISLIDGKKLYSYGAKDPFSIRSFFAFDPATLVHVDSDTITYASECGIIYQFKLNTQYDEAAGTISIKPDNILKWRYSTKRTRNNGTKDYWLGFESSPVMFRNFMYVADNAGNLFCIDINTMETVWMQDVMDDTNCSPVLDVNEQTGEARIYIGTSLHWTANSSNTGMIPFWCIDALTGEIIWKDEGYRCTRSSVSGGIQDTAALGKNKLDDLVYVAYAMTTETPTRGILVAYNKSNGNKVWTANLDAYSWSSPLILYDENGYGYVIEFDSAGKMYLFDGRTGQLLDKLQLEGNFEASAAAFGNRIVIGSRASKIYCISLG